MALLPVHDPTSPVYKKARRQYLKATKNRNNTLEDDWTPFRAAEKRFMARFPPPDLSGVLDLALLDPARTPEIQQGIWRGAINPDWYSLIDEHSSRPAFTIHNVPGLVVLPNFISHEQQRQLVHWALVEHAKHPNLTNLDTHYHLPPQGIWNSYADSISTKQTKPSEIQPKNISAGSMVIPQSGPRELVNNTPASPTNFKSLVKSSRPPALPSPSARPAIPADLLVKLRWANIGWFYHWGTKQYDFTQGRGDIRDDVRRLCKSAIASVDWERVFGGELGGNWGEGDSEWRNWNDTYEPDAGIINFYQTKDTLMAHVDRSEICATSPLVSISLGAACVFLIGGRTRENEPIPLLLRSGDVLIMSGPNCRRAYHGVPRILEGTSPPQFEREEARPEWDLLSEYMQGARINVNVRQVFPKGFDPFASIKSSDGGVGG